MAKVWIFAEGADGTPTTSALELATKARSLGDVSAVYVGEPTETAVGALGQHGVAKIFVANPGDRLSAAPLARTLETLVESESPDLFLFGQGYNERDVAGRLAARLGRSVLSNAVDVEMNGTVTTKHEIFGGTQIATAELTGAAPHIVLTRPKSFAAEPGGDTTPEVIELELQNAGAAEATVTGSHIEEREGPQLEEANVIVAGGRGLGSAEKFELIERIAKPLKAATGATRAIVDSGWVPYAKQVGQTGKTVKPDVYVAAGISGAMQHLVGMKDSKVIIAINKDPDAPIFSIADLGIVGDINNVLPKLAEELEKRS